MNDSAKSPLDIQDFLDAATEAGKRCRTVTILLAVGSVLLFAGLLNSLQSHWMLQRLEKFQDINSDYVKHFLGAPPVASPDLNRNAANVSRPELSLYEHRYVAMNTALMRSFVDNSLVIKVPFFGFGFDVNDLGLLGGLAFVVLLSIYRFALSRELDNIRIGFLEAEALGQLKEFYTLLAMHQVFTVPWTPGKEPSRFLLFAPKCVCVLPLLVQFSIVAHDASTYDVGSAVGWTHTLTVLVIEVLLLLSILPLSLMAFRRMRRTDALWDMYAERLDDNPLPASWRRRRLVRRISVPEVNRTNPSDPTG